MQERAVSTQTNTCINTSMESADSVDIDDSSDLQQEQSSRSRNSNNKLKVLVRSHAMREASPSPPRDPQSPNATTAHYHHHNHYQPIQTQHQQSSSQQMHQPNTPVSSPCIKLTPSSDSHPSSPTRTLHVLSPSSSPTSTLVASPSPTRLVDQSEFTLQEATYTTADVGHRCTKTNKHSRKKNHYERDDEHRSNGAIGGNVGMKCECQSNLTLNNNNLHNNNNNNTLTVNNRFGNSGNGRGKLRQQSSSLGSFDGSSPSLSRDNSSEQYTDTTGADLEIFIPETLNRNQKDRNLMLRIEEELVQLAKDDGQTHFKFPPMSSYQRMLVHRCAAYFGMEHNIESTGKCVVVNKTKNTRIPDVEFKFHIKEEYNEEPRRSILKRDSNSIEDYNFKSPDRQYSLESRRSKSFEEREEEYEKAKRRIFNKGNHDCSADDIVWAEEIAWSNNDHESKYRLHNDCHHPRSSRLLKVQSEDPGEETMRPCVAKSYSFGGYGGSLARGDSMMSTHSAGPRLLSKQDSSASSVSWHLSPSSSGYKTQSQRSESITPSPTSTPFYSSNDSSSIRQDSTATNASDIPLQNDDDNQQVVWAVTNIQSVPKGSVIINPQTGQPIKNHDGTLYHHDPNNPLPELPPLPDATITNNGNTTAHVSAKPPMSPVKSKKDRPPSPKKRNSPIKKTNSATSPSLPYTPPPHPLSLPTIPQMPVATQLIQSKNFPGYAEHNPAPLMQNQYYGGTYDYAPPCIVYAPYGQVPVGYDTRIDTTPLQELTHPYYVDPTTYQSAPAAAAGVWSQTQYVYPNAAPRFAVQPMQQPGTTTFIASYHAGQTTSGFVPQQAQPTSGASSEMIPVYSPQSLIYPTAQTSVFPNQNMIYAAAPPPSGGTFANTVFTAPPPSTAVAQHNMTYPVNVLTPEVLYPMEQMVQGVAQLHLSAAKDERRMTPKGKGRSQSSTEASSPATAVMTFPGALYHRQNSETPPSLPPTPGYGGSFPPVFLRQMSNVRASPPVQSRASRSPTPVTPTMPLPPMALPGPDMIMGDSRHRYSMPPVVYQTMPYSIPSDSRIIAGRGQPNSFRQQSPRPPPNLSHPPHRQQVQSQNHQAAVNNSNSNSNSHVCGVPQYNQHAPPANDKFKNRKNRL
ncbi:cAMP-regulated phosphoprotein 21 isoform X2 [Atheta coriaria]|uniref:cAMP-regulated phosphoprotein 21 isoform X2 n=1 Tax=Dalotia coriaria TaxID=877792 RepID=UPI0031F3BC77